VRFCYIFSLFQRALGDRSFVIKNRLPCRFNRASSSSFSALRIGLVSAGNIVALYLQEQLPFFTVSPSRAFTSTTRPAATEITGTERAISAVPRRYIQRGRSLIIQPRRQRKLLGMVGLEIVRVQIGLDVCRRRSFGLGISLAFVGIRPKRE